MPTLTVMCLKWRAMPRNAAARNARRIVSDEWPESAFVLGVAKNGMATTVASPAASADGVFCCRGYLMTRGSEASLRGRSTAVPAEDPRRQPRRLHGISARQLDPRLAASLVPRVVPRVFARPRRANVSSLFITSFACQGRRSFDSPNCDA